MQRFLLILLVVGCWANIDDQPEVNSVSEEPIKNGSTEKEKVSSGVIDENGCFHEPWEFCLTESEKQGGCDCNPHLEILDAIVCCNVTDLENALKCIPQQNISVWSYLQIHNLTRNDLELNRTIFKQMTSVAVTNGKIKRIVGSFSKMSQPKCLNFSNNNILEIENPRALSTLPRLKMLDLSRNNLTNMLKLNNNGITVDIRENSNISCKSVADIFVSSIQFVDINNTFCKTKTNYNWFNSSEIISTMNLKRMKQLQNDCPIFGNQSCKCTANRMLHEGNDLVFNAQVNCSGLGLTRLPEKLPENTIFLDISNNNISTLIPDIVNNSDFSKLTTLLAENNKISSILDLEGSDLLKNFVKLNFRKNKIKRIPIYLLNKALNNMSASDTDKIILLADNKMFCDCDTRKLTSMFLHAHRSQFDSDWIFCETMEKMIDDPGKVCSHEESDNIYYYIYYVIALEIFLLFALVIKVGYDYWVFKTTGFLPFPASSILLRQTHPTSSSKSGFQKTP